MKRRIILMLAVLITGILLIGVFVSQNQNNSYVASTQPTTEAVPAEAPVSNQYANNRYVSLSSLLQIHRLISISELYSFFMPVGAQCANR